MGRLVIHINLGAQPPYHAVSLDIEVMVFISILIFNCSFQFITKRDCLIEKYSQHQSWWHQLSTANEQIETGRYLEV